MKKCKRNPKAALPNNKLTHGDAVAKTNKSGSGTDLGRGKHQPDQMEKDETVVTNPPLPYEAPGGGHGK